MPFMKAFSRLFLSNATIHSTWQNQQTAGDGTFLDEEQQQKNVDASHSTESESNTSNSGQDAPTLVPPPSEIAPSEAAATCHSRDDDDDDEEQDDFEDEFQRRKRSLSPDVFFLYQFQRRFAMQQRASYIEQSEDEVFSYTVDEEDEDEQDLENFHFADELPVDNVEWKEHHELERRAQEVSSQPTRFFPVFLGNRNANETTATRENQANALAMPDVVITEEGGPRGDDVPDKTMIGTARGRTSTKFWWLMAFGALCLGFLMVVAPYFIYDSTRSSDSNASSRDGKIWDVVEAVTNAPTIAPVSSTTSPPTSIQTASPTFAPSVNLIDRPAEEGREFNLHTGGNVTVDLKIIRSAKHVTLYQVTDDVVQLGDNCEGEEWTSRATILYSIDAEKGNGLDFLSVEILNGIDTTIVECHDQVVTKTSYHIFVGSGSGNDDDETPASGSVDEIDFAVTMDFSQGKTEIEISVAKAGSGVVLLVPDSLTDASAGFFILPPLETRPLNEPVETNVHVRPQVGDECPSYATWLPMQPSSILSGISFWQIPKAVAASGPEEEEARTVYACAGGKTVTGVGRLTFPVGTTTAPSVSSSLDAPSLSPSVFPSIFPSVYPSIYATDTED